MTPQHNRLAFFECAGALLLRTQLGALAGPPSRDERAEMALVYRAGGTVKAAVWTVLRDRQMAPRQAQGAQP